MTINNEKVVEILQKSPTAEAFATYAACRNRNVREGISRLPSIRAQMAKEGFHPVPQDLLSMFRELERAGIGHLWKDQFKWNVPIKEVASYLEVPKKKTSAQVYTHQRAVAEKTLVMSFGTDKKVSITFTPNLSKEDVDFMISKMLKECES